MFLFRRAAIGVVLSILATGSAQALIIDHGTYTTDTTTGLDWLDVTASLGRTFNDVNSQFGVGGDFEGWGFARLCQARNWRSTIGSERW